MRGPGARRMRWTAGTAVVLALVLAATALGAAPVATTGPATAVGATTATVGGHGRPAWTGDDVVGRVRDVHLVRIEDGCRERRSGVERRRERLGEPHGIEDGDDLPLPRRCDERGRHESRRRRRADDARPARRHDRRCDEHHRLRRHPERNRRPERAVDDLLLRLRDVDELRHEDEPEERRLGHECTGRGGHDRRAGCGPHLPLPHRRDERRGHDDGEGRHLHDELGAHRGDRRRDVDHADCRDAPRHGDPERPLDDLVVRVRHDDLVRFEDFEPQRRLGHRRTVRLAGREVAARGDRRITTGSSRRTRKAGSPAPTGRSQPSVRRPRRQDCRRTSAPTPPC